MKIEDLVLGKKYQFIKEGVKKTLIGKRIKIVELDISKNKIVGKMLEDSSYSRRHFDRFKKGQKIFISFVDLLTEIA